MKKFIFIPELVEDNPFLNLFYNDKSRWALHMELYLLNAFKAGQDKGYLLSSAYDKTLLMDWGIVPVFAKMLFDCNRLSKVEYKLYCDIEKNLQVKCPDLLVFLDIDANKAKDRIHKRGRECEKQIWQRDDNYLQLLSEAYYYYLRKYDGDVLFVPDSKLDYSEELICSTIKDDCKYIWVTGIIGSGKTTLCKKLSMSP